MGVAVARVGDIVVGYCDGSGHSLHRAFTGVWTTGSDVVTADNIGIVRVGDVGTTDCGHSFIAATGSDILTVDGISAHRVGDVVIVEQGGSGVTMTGSDTVTTE